MFAVRFAALTALAVWLGVLIALAVLGDSGATEIFRPLHLLTYGCGAAVLLGLFLMKFVGPPPRAFPLRALLVGSMLALQYALAARYVPPVARLANILLALLLLHWYVRE